MRFAVRQAPGVPSGAGPVPAAPETKLYTPPAYTACRGSSPARGAAELDGCSAPVHKEFLTLGFTHFTLTYLYGNMSKPAK